MRKTDVWINGTPLSKVDEVKLDRRPDEPAYEGRYAAALVELPELKVVTRSEYNAAIFSRHVDLAQKVSLRIRDSKGGGRTEDYEVDALVMGWELDDQGFCSAFFTIMGEIRPCGLT